MPDPHHTKIITRKTPDGLVEISVYDHTGEKEHRTGMKAPAAEADRACAQLAQTLKRAGNRVSHKEI